MKAPFSFLLALSCVAIVCACASSALASPAPAGDEEGVTFENRSMLLKDCLIKAKETSRPLMIDFYADWCGWCKKLDEETYSDPLLATFMKNFVNMKINAELGEGPGLVKGYKISGYPYILFLDSDGEVIDWISGYLDADGFLARVEDIYAGKNTFRDFKRRYEADSSDLDAAVGYAGKLDQRGEETLSGSIYEAALVIARKEKKPQAGTCLARLAEAALRDGDWERCKQLYEEQIGDYPQTDGIINAYLILVQIYAELERDLDKAVALMSGAVTAFAETEYEMMVRFQLVGLLERKDDYAGALAEIDKIDEEQVPEDELFPTKVRIWVKMGNRAEAEQCCKRWRESCGKVPEQINSVAWTCHENRILLKEALAWARQAVELSEEEQNHIIDTYAWLLYDNGDPEGAAEWEEKALFAAETDEENEAYAQALKVFRKAIREKK